MFPNFLKNPLYFSLQPLFLNEVLVKMPPDPSSDEPVFHVSHIDRVYTLKTETLSERYARTNARSWGAAP